MPITSGIKYRLKPTDEQAEALSQWIGCQRFIYNAKVGEDRYFRTFLKKSLSLTGEKTSVDQKYSQFITEGTAFLREVPSQILRNGAYRWMTGYQRFFKKLGGRPTFRGKNGRQSVLVTSELYSIDTGKGVVRLGTTKHPVGEICYTLHGERNLPLPKSICIARHANKWWLSFNFTQDQEFEEEPLSELELIRLFGAMSKEELKTITTGFDRGVAIPIAGSSGTDFDFDPVVRKRLDQKLHRRRNYQRRIARQQEGSSRWKRIKLLIDKTHEYQGDARKDFAHKASRVIVDSASSLFVFEDLKIKNMTRKPKAKKDESGKWLKNGARAKAGLNKSILGSAWGNLLVFTAYKGLRKNKLTIKIQPNGTSQECSRCGHIHPGNRVSQSLFACQSCGFTANADFNASLNIKRWGIDQIGGISVKKKKSVRFRRTESPRDGTSEAMRDSAAATGEPVEQPIPPAGGRRKTSKGTARRSGGQRTAKPPLQLKV